MFLKGCEIFSEKFKGSEIYPSVKNKGCETLRGTKKRLRDAKISKENLRGARISVENLRGMKNFQHFPKNTPTGYPDWTLLEETVCIAEPCTLPYRLPLRRV